MSRVLVTGATGFVGRHVVPQLTARGHEVHAVARTLPAQPWGPTHWHAVDLLDPPSVEGLTSAVGATHLLHLAWHTEHAGFWQAPENLDWVAASLALVGSFHAAGGERVVVAGTCAEYDWSKDCCDSTSPLRPATPYGKAKNELRDALEYFARTGGPEVAWGRIFFLYGPGEQPSRVIAAVARALVNDEPIETSPGDQIRDFLHVADVAAAFTALVDGGTTGSLDIGSGSGVALREILLRIEELAGRRGLVRFSEALRRDEPGRIVADSTEIRALGWKPEIDLGSGLRRTLAWWREELAAGRQT